MFKDCSDLIYTTEILSLFSEYAVVASQNLRAEQTPQEFLNPEVAELQQENCVESSKP
jgi:hypothetical protein